MNEIKDHLKDISEIRSMMEKNSKFLSLSGLSGVSAGICALIGAFVAWKILGDYSTMSMRGTRTGAISFLLLLDAGAVFISAFGLAVFFSSRMAKKKGLEMWNKTTWRMIGSLAVPLAAGGVFGLIQLYHGYYIFIGATTLIFYGLALLNASKFTLNEIKYLAYSEIVLGLMAGIWVRNGLLFWAIGFGVLHIFYGAMMYWKYER